MTEIAELAVAIFAQRPDLLGKVFGPEIQSAVPEFMRHDPVSALYYGNGQLEHCSELGLAAVDPAEPARPVANAFSVPFAFREGTRGRDELPDSGWDAVIRWADEDRRAAPSHGGQRPRNHGGATPATEWHFTPDAGSAARECPAARLC